MRAPSLPAVEHLASCSRLTRCFVGSAQQPCRLQGGCHMRTGGDPAAEACTRLHARPPPLPPKACPTALCSTPRGAGGPQAAPRVCGGRGRQAHQHHHPHRHPATRLRLNLGAAGLGLLTATSTGHVRSAAPMLSQTSRTESSAQGRDSQAAAAEPEGPWRCSRPGMMPDDGYERAQEAPQHSCAFSHVNSFDISSPQPRCNPTFDQSMMSQMHPAIHTVPCLLARCCPLPCCLLIRFMNRLAGAQRAPGSAFEACNSAAGLRRFPQKHSVENGLTGRPRLRHCG